MVKFIIVSSHTLFIKIADLTRILLKEMFANVININRFIAIGSVAVLSWVSSLCIS